MSWEDDHEEFWNPSLLKSGFALLHESEVAQLRSSGAGGWSGLYLMTHSD